MKPSKPVIKQRSQRPFACLNRSRWDTYLKDPSSQVMLLSKCGKATQKRFLVDIAKVMDCLVSNMCLRTRKIGFIAPNGFFLLTWQTIAERCDLPLWRVKQCASRIIENGWLESTQPRERKTGADNRLKWVCLASIKRVTLKYIKVTGLSNAFRDAHAAAKKSVVKLAERYKTEVKYLLTPITLLARRRANRPATDTNAPPN